MAEIRGDRIVHGNSTSDVTSPGNGHMYWNGTTKKLRIHNGTNWGSVTVDALGTLNSPASSAAAILAETPAAGNGTYYIQASGSNVRQTYCDMTGSDGGGGGGWMLVGKIHSGESTWNFGNGIWTNNSTFNESNCLNITAGISGKHWLWNEFNASQVRVTQFSSPSTIFVTFNNPSGTVPLYNMMQAGENTATTLTAGNMNNFSTFSTAFQGDAFAQGGFPNEVRINTNRNMNTGYGCCDCVGGVRIGRVGGAHNGCCGGFNVGGRGGGGYGQSRDMHDFSCCPYGMQGFENWPTASGQTIGIWVK